MKAGRGGSGSSSQADDHTCHADTLHLISPRLHFPHLRNMESSSQPEPSHRKHKRPLEQLSKSIHYIKASDGGGFKSFGDFISALFAPPPTDPDATDGERQTVLQTVKAFLKWIPLYGLLKNISSHPLMVRDENTRGMVPPHCISPKVPLLEGTALLLQCWYS